MSNMFYLKSWPIQSNSSLSSIRSGNIAVLFTVCKRITVCKRKIWNSSANVDASNWHVSNGKVDLLHLYVFLLVPLVYTSTLNHGSIIYSAEIA